MRAITVTYTIDELIDLCAGVTLSRIYDNTDHDRNNLLLDLYGITKDDMEVFEKHCLKFACDYVYLAVKRHSWGRMPFRYSVMDNQQGHLVVIYNLMIGRVQERPAIEGMEFNDIISDYMARCIRDYALKEWYKLKGNLEWAQFHEAEFEVNKRQLLDFTQGNNSDIGGMNIGKRNGYPFN